MEAAMTDYQFESIIKLVLKIVKNSKDKNEIEAALADLLKEKQAPKDSDK
ncbi:MAG: hypothetical protein FWC55_04880 [Firmicutes bacterium]|nr:hypothetical protein [Bacillota bacterium]